MPRPKNIMPTVRQRRRKSFTELRVWYADKWHPVGKLGDSPSEVRERVMRVVAGNLPPVAPKPLPQPHGLTIAKLFTAFLNSDASPKNHQARAGTHRAGRLLCEFCGKNALAAGMTSLQFEDWRDWLCTKRACVYRGKLKGTEELDKLLSHQYVMRLMRFTRRVYRWAAKRRLIPVHVSADLVNSERPRLGQARRATVPTPVSPADAQAVIPHLQPVVRDMLAIQRATAARPSEIWRMRPCDVHRAGTVAVGKVLVNLDSPDTDGCWLYLPAAHKTDHTGDVRAIPIPHSVQPVLTPYLERDPSAFCFSPIEQETRRGREPRRGQRPMRAHFDTQSYTRSIRYACKRAGVSPWTAYQIRHLGIYEVAAQHGARAAQLFAGHKDLTTTSKYLAFDAKTLFMAAKNR